MMSTERSTDWEVLSCEGVQGLLTNEEVDPPNKPPPKAGAGDADAPNAGVDGPKAGVGWPPKGLLCGWLLPKADVVELKENADELAAPKAGVLDPNRPPAEETPPKLKAITGTI